MKILVLNGSPKRDKSDTMHMTRSFLTGINDILKNDVHMVYQGVFCRWLSKTGNHIDERPVFDIYRKVEENGYMEIDICFPLK